MAEIKPMALIESMSKKVCEHSDVLQQDAVGNPPFGTYGEQPL